MGQTATKIAAEMLAEMQSLAASMKEEAAACRREAAVPVLVGHGFICVLASDGSMAVAPDQANREHWRLVFIKHHRCGILHWSKTDAEMVAAHWNNGVEPSLQVKAVHYKDALLRHAAGLESSVAALEVRLQELVLAAA